MSVANCPFCDATVALVQSGRAAALEDEAYLMARFAVSEQAFRDRFLAYLADGDYTPPDVIEAAQVQRHTGLFAPVYVFKGRWVSRFTARVGDDHEETYVAEEKVQDAKGRTPRAGRARAR
jgi:hypothetical protein